MQEKFRDSIKGPMSKGDQEIMKKIDTYKESMKEKVRDGTKHWFSRD